jgi:predicted nicotinamide N-methyase
MDSDTEETEYEIEEFDLNNYKLSITTVAYLPITTLLANRVQEKEISGQKLWCGSLSVVNYLFKYPEYVRDSFVVELGAGTGVVSIIAAKLGATVMATDHDERSLIHMREDFPRNSVDISVESLNWYSPDLSVIEKSLETASFEKIIILAGDVLYKEVLIEPFLQTVRAILSLKANSELLLCHIPRAGVFQEIIQERLRTEQFSFEIIPSLDWNYGDLLQKYSPIEDIERAQMYKIKLM